MIKYSISSSRDTEKKLLLPLNIVTSSTENHESITSQFIQNINKIAVLKNTKVVTKILAYMYYYQVINMVTNVQ